MKNSFEIYLKNNNLSDNTIKSYLFTISQFKSSFKTTSKESIESYKIWLIDNYKPKTVNLRLQAINCYLEYLNKPNLKVHFVKIQQKTYLENVISNADYEYLKKSLKQDNEVFWYFVVRFLAGTGARISELLQIKVEHIETGYLDLYSKGGKIRRIYIPLALKKEAQTWINSRNQKTGFLFVNKYGNRITSRGISGQLKKFAIKYNIDKKVVYPHSFRHRFAKNFLEKYNDIALLADLMGHESIETTRIYLRRTSTEQQAIVDKVINW